MHFRQAQVEDAAAIQQLTRSAYEKWVAVIGREPKPMTVDYEVRITAHRFDLLFEGTDLVGLVETVSKGDGLLIENVAVSPGLQRRGLGSALLAHVESLATHVGLRWVRLYTNQRFAENIDFYERRGYRIEREEDLGFGVAIHMSKALSADPA